MKHRENKYLDKVYKMDFITEHDIYLLKQGTHHKLYNKLGAHITTKNEEPGTSFGLWAPNAEKVFVTGDFNGWNRNSHPLKQREDESGVWEGFIPGIKQGDIYKYHIQSRFNNFKADKGDPFAFYWEKPPKTASIVWELSYQWNDSEWIAERHKYNALSSPFCIYEVHLGSWKRTANESGRFLTYREIACELVDYVKEMGFTHVELMPVTEHPFYGSWGYQTTGYFAPTSRYGTPQDFMYLIDHLHQHDIGVILDWVPSHFPSDEHGLAYFDGTCLYEHADPKMGFHPEWKSYIFNYSRNEIRAFLISSALFWFDKYHIDAIRVDAVASMLYLDYARKDGEWIPNKYGGHENLDAINFLKRLNEAVYVSHPDVQMIAEESTAWPMVSRPTSIGGLGFGMKWNMGWMHDTLQYFSKDPVYRKSHHNELAFSIWYAFSENFLLPLSHDEVVHGKGSLIGKMPGDEWQRYANLRLLFGHMYGHPGKKLIFMGGEFAQWKEWDHDECLEWFVLQHHFHQGMRDWVKDLNQLYRTSPAMYEQDFSRDGFEWIDFHDYEQSIISYIRKGKSSDEIVLAVCNATPVPRHNYNVGVPGKGYWKEVLNSDAEIYGGSGCGNSGGVQAVATPAHGRKYSLYLTLPPLGIIFFKNLP